MTSLSSAKSKRKFLMRVVGNSGGITPLEYRFCQGSIGTPVDSTQTVAADTVTCSSGAIEIDSVAAGTGIVEVYGVWRLS